MSDSKYCKIFRNEEENFSINENWNLTIGKWLARRSKQRKSLISRLKKESEEIIIKEKTLRETQKSTNLSETPSIDAVNRFNTKWKFNNKFFLQKKLHLNHTSHITKSIIVALIGFETVSVRRRSEISFQLYDTSIKAIYRWKLDFNTVSRN